MMFLMMMVMYWTQTEGGCSGAIVSISGEDRVLSAREGFNLSCKFTGLRPQHVAQLWRSSGDTDGVSLVNITSILPDVIVVLSISSVTMADTGYYYCMTQPPDTISPEVHIQIADNLTPSTLTRPSTAELETTQQPSNAADNLALSNLTIYSTAEFETTQQPSNAAGLQCQMWFWLLLGKTAVLFLSLTALAVKHNRNLNDLRP